MSVTADMTYALISPCRNEADYMRRTLDSVIAQTVRPDLWLIVDDGSSMRRRIFWPNMQRRMTGTRLRQSQIVVTELWGRV